MLATLLEKLTGRDDLERIAHKNDIAVLTSYLQKRPVFIPQQPKRFLDAANFTQQELLELIQADAAQLANEPFEPWLLDVDGEKLLPVFSNQDRMTTFASKISQDLNKVFGLGFGSFLLESLTNQVEIDVVDINRFSKHGFEIRLRTR
ncbi:hypothetical protein [Lacipirellula parvula]|uniref:Uncharacterized protein n=1 Tax=Lacipirellula parvula TaxID=2650471 RepID=A0A5K7XLS7_9BACT|nr:hypothetical protein [Lacipirellula parvula]BBO35473.1 hypothetical protein PLANPX_5085 [Lacipirellula parvula]